MKVYLNAGHDRELDPGAVNRRLHLRECDAAYELALGVQQYLERNGIAVVFGQDDDLYHICDQANQAECDLFVSIHLGEMHPLYVKQTPFYERLFVISLPQKAKQSTWDNDELSFGYLRKAINNQPRLQSYNFEIAKIKSYSTSVEAGEKMENKGIATIQDYMIEREKNMVSRLVKSNLLNAEQYLLKDGSLEYQIHDLSSKEAKIFCNNYRFVVGASKSFNPANCIDKHKNNNSNLIAKLPLYHRTPVQLYQSDKIGDNMNFAIWFVRIRNQMYTNNAFDGILKLEKILTDDESEKGLETGEVDVITANIINERNPVCYGVDKRWANHLYPIYVTEKFIKSMYLSENMFLSFF